MYGIYYLMFSTFAKFFGETYHFKAGVGGLAYLGLGVGFFLASVFGAKFADSIYKSVSSVLSIFVSSCPIPAARG
jgi:predicted MFS family arabinose efflux permease